MATNNPNYTRYSTDRLVVNGHLASNGSSVTYTKSGGTSETKTMAQLFASFVDQDVEISISTQFNRNVEGVTPPSNS